MTAKAFLQGPWFQRTVLVVWLVSSALVVFSQKNIDQIVHGTLYGYGLQFSPKWAEPYWLYARLMYTTQFASIALTMVALISGGLKKDDGEKSAPKPKRKSHRSISVKEEPTVGVTFVSCPSCKRVISKPLVMMDFTRGKARLVNACPYCSALLEEAEEKVSYKTGTNRNE